MSSHAEESDTSLLATAVTEFSLKLYRTLITAETENLVVSPLSIHLVLSALGSAANESTKAELQAALELADITTAHEPYAAILSQINLKAKSDSATTSSLVNAAWIQQGYPLNPKFGKFLQEHYGAYLERVDFNSPSVAVSVVNRWLAEQTNNKIENLLSKNSIHPLTRLVVTNAVHFKGEWLNQFYPHLTAQQSFAVSESEQIQVPMMGDQQVVSYHENEAAQLVALPYAGQDYEFVMVVPRIKHGLTKVERSLNPEVLRRWLKQMEPRKVEYYLPRFSFTKRIEVSSALKSLGIIEAFDPQGSAFPGISEVEPLTISAMLHEGFIAVDEQGTEAAAATAAIVAGSAYDPEPPTVVRADHPFLFFIIHKPTQTMLFVGRVVRP